MLSVVLRLAVADKEDEDDEEEDDKGVDMAPAPAFSLIASAPPRRTLRRLSGFWGHNHAPRRPRRGRGATQGQEVQRGREEEESNEAKKPSARCDDCLGSADDTRLDHTTTTTTTTRNCVALCLIGLRARGEVWIRRKEKEVF